MPWKKTTNFHFDLKSASLLKGALVSPKVLEQYNQPLPLVNI